MPDIRVKDFEITDTFSIEHLVIRPGALTIITGVNGSGKSSCLDAIKGIFESGYHPDRIRRGTKKSVVQMTLTNGFTVTRTTTVTGYTLKVVSPDGVEVPKPQAFVDSLAASFAFDPLSFIMADKKDRAKFLLEAMPVHFSVEEVQAAMGERFPDPLTLDQFNGVHKRLFDERAALNRQARDAEGTIRDLSHNLPADGEEIDWREQAAAQEAELGKLGEAEATQRAIVAKNLSEELEEITKQAERAKDDARLLAEGNLHAITERFCEPRSKHQQEIALARANLEQSAKVAGMKQTIEQMRAKYRETAGKSDRMTVFLENLENLKRERLAKLPIAGVEVREGEIFINGLSFETQINTARKILLSFQIASLKAGSLPLMVADNLEHLDQQTMADFIEAAKQSGFQIVSARVGADPQLKVETMA
jgi:energy-coupling factor transporter ATP-binding protein EcfA2